MNYQSRRMKRAKVYRKIDNALNIITLIIIVGFFILLAGQAGKNDIESINYQNGVSQEGTK